MKKKIILLALAIFLLAQFSGCSVSEETAVSDCVFDIIYDSTQGNAWSDSKDGYYPAGTEITAHAVGGEGKDFMCWTVGGYLEDGGTDISHEPDYTFSLSDNLWLYANFKSDDISMVRYYANGGTVTETGEDVYDQQFSLEYYIYPNSLASLDYFSRDGYILYSYNTQSDGSGEAFNLGGKVFIETNRIIDLYCMWAKQASVSNFDFEYDNSNQGWFITAYTGDEDILCLPETYNNEPVIGIKTGALCGASMDTLIIPDAYRFVQDGSCADCENLHTLYLFDSLSYISDAAFENCAIEHYYFNAATLPRFSTYFNNHAKKIEVLCHTSRTADKPRIICVGGSSTTYAVDCQEMEANLNADYMVINMGTNGANLWTLTSGCVLQFLNEGDIVLHIPEYSAWQFGGVMFDTWESFRSFESCYNVYSWVDGSIFDDMLDSFCAYLEARADVDTSTYEEYSSTTAPEGYFDDQGALNVHVEANRYGEDYLGSFSITICGNFLYDFMVDNNNAAYNAIRDQGATALLSWTPLNINAMVYPPESQEIDDFVNYMEENLDVPIISDIHNSFYTGDNFYDSDYHLCYESRLIYSDRLADDLNAWFAEQDG